jgi:hypothetical protein
MLEISFEIGSNQEIFEHFDINTRIFFIHKFNQSESMSW